MQLKQALGLENLQDLNLEDSSTLEQLAENLGGIDSLQKILELIALQQVNQEESEEKPESKKSDNDQ